MSRTEKNSPQTVATALFFCPQLHAAQAPVTAPTNNCRLANLGKRPTQILETDSEQRVLEPGYKACSRMGAPH